MRAEGPARVLLVGRGAPERGGIPTFLDMVSGSPFPSGTRVDLLNLGSASLREGGRASLANVTRTFTDAWRVWRGARDHDVVHLNTAFAPTITALRAALLLLAARLAGAHVVVHVHGGRVALWMTTPTVRRIGRLCLRPAHDVIAVSEAVRDVLVQACGPERVRLMDNAVDTTRFHGPPARDGAVPRVLFAGGLTPRKGVVDLLDASRLLDEQGVPHELWLAGGTPDEGTEAEEQVRAATGPSARFLGPCDPQDMPGLYRSVDLFCLPSWYEAMPLSVLEAMATGLPVVATTVGDVPRLVEDGRQGLLVPPRAPEQLADALRELLVDPERAAAMGVEGRRAADTRFSLSRLVADLDRLYTRPVEPAT